MKALSIIALCVLLQGCYQTVNQQDIYQAGHFCKGSEKISEITAHFSGEEHVVCRNGKKIRADKIEVQE